MKLHTQHSLGYDLYNAEKLADEFLLNVKKGVTRSSIYFFIKFGCSLENMQPSPV